MSNKKLGVIGGMGPMATSMFFERVINRTVATRDQEHIDMVILNHATMPDRTEAILSGNHELFLNSIQKDFETLALIGVDHIAIPCNTSHFFMEKMLQMTQIPIIDMVKETALEIRVRFGEGAKVGILATDGTIRTGTYEHACLSNGLNFVKPSTADQEVVMKLIYAIKSDLPIDVAAFEEIIEKLLNTEKCTCVILACTELSLLNLSAHLTPKLIDAMDVLVKKSILYSDKRYKE